MNGRYSIWEYILLCACLLFFFSGCAVYDSLFGQSEELLPAELMSEGLQDLESGNYKSAAEKFQELKDRYPYSDFAIEAELKMADAQFRSKEYDAAYIAYDEFERMHPRDKSIPYVIYQKGLSKFEQVNAIDRDQSYSLIAKEEFERLVKRFPNDEYADRARRNIRKCLINLAEYELHVGHFYYKNKEYNAAIERYIYLIKNYPDMGQYYEALEYIGRCKERLVENLEQEDADGASENN